MTRIIHKIGKPKPLPNTPGWVTISCTCDWCALTREDQMHKLQHEAANHLILHETILANARAS